MRLTARTTASVQFEQLSSNVQALQHNTCRVGNMRGSRTG
ncbi:hypothetical protein APY04_2844 [Hyphomicrobium sulfonivorans]|uniref:Uncharacterized protein n=1 Tax=Hyphomicrobium sulfonivorans TaxID=121290 RepID=A0A120CTX6_HYPSL|nr:hypothetical protein APY04_2844 [Hyphomicrobium sulfonivorans]